MRLPRLVPGEAVSAEELAPEGHTTQPPARYTEASLVKALEELGVGRPSTYATIMDTVQSRGYVWKKGTALVPSWTAFAVVGLLEQHFAKLVDYGFTAQMEEDLDGIARGDEEPLPWLTRFYFGTPGAKGDDEGLKQLVAERLAEIDARAINSISVGDPSSGVLVRVGRFGPMFRRARGGRRSPRTSPPTSSRFERALQLLDAPTAEQADRELGPDPVTGLPVLVRAGRYGPYIQLGRADELSTKPKTSSLLSGMVPEDVTLEDALRLLTLPRKLGKGADGEEIVVDKGRYGPYVRKGTDYRSLETEDQLFTVTIEDALDLFSRPRTRGNRQASLPLAEIGADPVSGNTITVKEGRFGLYVTDGTVNASLRRGDSVETLTLERAAELLADRRPGPRPMPPAVAVGQAGGPGAPGAEPERADGPPVPVPAAARRERPDPQPRPGAGPRSPRSARPRRLERLPPCVKPPARFVKPPLRFARPPLRWVKPPLRWVKPLHRCVRPLPRCVRPLPRCVRPLPRPRERPWSRRRRRPKQRLRKRRLRKRRRPRRRLRRRLRPKRLWPKRLWPKRLWPKRLWPKRLWLGRQSSELQLWRALARGRSSLFWPYS